MRVETARRFAYTKSLMRFKYLVLVAIYVITSSAWAGSTLENAGYCVLPAPQEVKLDGHDVSLGPELQLAISPGMAPDDVAVEALKEGLKERHGLRVVQTALGTPVIRLV